MLLNSHINNTREYSGSSMVNLKVNDFVIKRSQERLKIAYIDSIDFTQRLVKKIIQKW